MLSVLGQSNKRGGIMTPQKRTWETSQKAICERINRTREELLRDLQEVGNGRIFTR